MNQSAIVCVRARTAAREEVRDVLLADLVPEARYATHVDGALHFVDVRAFDLHDNVFNGHVLAQHLFQVERGLCLLATKQGCPCHGRDDEDAGQGCS